MPKHRLDADDMRSSDRMLAWLLILFGYIISMGVAMDPAGWDDPVFNIVRKLPYTPFSWSVILAFGVTIYTVGEMMSDDWRGRGSIIITGAALCALWCCGLSCMMARMVYETPTRITILWPFVMFFCAALYASRIVVYASAFTGSRWATNPYQLWDTTFVLVVSLSQMIIGVAPGTILTEIEQPVMFELALVNFIGALMVMLGLHLKNKELGLKYELAGTFSLVFTLAWYCVSVTQKQTLAGTTLGFGLAEAFVFATLHRSLQILALKLARWRDHPRAAKRLERALNPHG